MSKVGDLTPDPKNARRHPERNLEVIADSLKTVGAARSIVIDEHGVVLAGNGVCQAAPLAGISKVRVVDAEGDEIIAVRRKGLTNEQKTRLALADNRAGELSEWNPEQIKSMQESGVDLQPFWTADELRAVIGEPPARGGRTDPDDVPPARATAIRSGDVFKLGAHRLLCGDSTSQADVALLCGNVSADMLWTDPPYGVAYQTKLSVNEAVARHRRTDGLEIANDSLSQSETRDLIVRALGVGLSVLKPGAAFYVCSPSGDMELTFRVALQDAGLRLRQAIVWVKDVFVMGRQDYHWRHESILYGWVDGAAHYFVDDRTQDTVWECQRPRASKEHPTMKPVALVERALRNSSRPGDAVYEPFSGSGTALVGCERLGRACYAVEIEPRYAQVSIDRWEAFTGQKAEKVGEVCAAGASPHRPS